MRAESDQQARQAHLLWSACQSLHRCVRANTPGVPWQQQLRPLKSEIENVSKAASEFIGTDDRCQTCLLYYVFGETLFDKLLVLGFRIDDAF